MIWVFGHGARCDTCVNALRFAGHTIERVVSPREDVNSPGFIKDYRAHNPSLAIVANFPHIFKKEAIDIPAWGTINLHAGRLPEYRGGSPLNWQIINGEKEIGISIIQMIEKIDAGPVIASTTFPLLDEDDISTVHAKANQAFAQMVCHILDRNAASGPFLASVPQDETKARYWHQRSDADSEIDWGWPPERIHNFVRALTHPYPGAKSKGLRIWKTSLNQ